MAKLYFRYSSMNAGKSTALLQVAHNYEEQGQSVRLFTAAIDDRYKVGTITSRLGPSREASVFDSKTDFSVQDFRGLACVLIDEAQFLTPSQVTELHKTAQVQNTPVICYGLRTDFRGEPFPGSAQLLALADDIEELKNICTCGKKATMNIRVDQNGKRIHHGDQIAIGGNESYRQVCGRCFYSNIS